MTDDLKVIKKMYGEKMMHLCRELFPTLLETEGLLSKLILDSFAPSRFLYDDIIKSYNIEKFKNYIYSLVVIEQKKVIQQKKTPKKLLEEVGYDFYECKTEKDIQKFKKYYAKGEELCTFDGGRLNRCHVFFAVKKNVDKIRRKDFSNPVRDDEYGTSVISIQFSRGAVNTLSIKNRYNHTVNNPDATFSNNLENIISGLTDSFEKEYDLNINQNEGNGFELLGYVKANDGKYYKYNYEINNIYYSPNNIIIDNFEVKKYDKEKYIVLDYFILDLVNKKIELYDKIINDSIIDGIKDIEKINIDKNEEIGNKQIEIITKNQNKIIIEIDKTNKMVGYSDKNIDKIGNNFLYFNIYLSNLELSNVKEIHHNFLYKNKNLKFLSLPNLIGIGNNFLMENKHLESISLPKLKEVGRYFIYYNSKIKYLNLPKLEKVGDSFLSFNENILILDLESLESAGNDFLHRNKNLNILNLPMLKEVGNSFLNSNQNLTSVNLPNLEEVGHSFLFSNSILNNLNLPNLKRASRFFLYLNHELTSIDFPLLLFIDTHFLTFNKKLNCVKMPKLVSAPSYGFLSSSKNIKILDLRSFNELSKSELPFYLRRLIKNNSNEEIYTNKINEVKKSDNSITKLIQKIINRNNSTKITKK